MIGHITRWEPPEGLSYTWRAPDWKGDTLIDVQFETVAGGTRVTVRHSGWEEARVLDVAEGYDVGLADILQRFASWMVEEPEGM